MRNCDCCYLIYIRIIRSKYTCRSVPNSLDFLFYSLPNAPKQNVLSPGSQENPQATFFLHTIGSDDILVRIRDNFVH
jgi:hypothetical protein